MRPFRKQTRQAFANFLRSKYEMHRGAVAPRARPYYLGLDPSSVCQLRCPVCATGVDNEARRQGTKAPAFRSNRTVLAAHLFDAVLDELGDYLFLLMFYNWGEPLLNNQLPAFIRKASDRDIETDVNTNLSLHLSDRDIDDLLGSGLSQLSASLDGFSQATYERYRVGGNLDLAKQNLERMVAARARLGVDTNLTWNFLVFSFNEHEVAAARQFCHDRGIEFNTRDAYVDELDWLPSYRRGERPMRASPEWRSPTVWSPLEAVEAPAVARCGWHYGYSMVNADGSVSPCCASWNQSDDFGRLQPGVTTFADVWNNDRFRAARAAFAGTDDGGVTESLCTRCPFGEGIQHLYSLLDVKVIMQFYRQPSAEHGALVPAFDLLTRARYGAEMHDLLRRGQFLSTAVLDCLRTAEIANRPPRDLGRHLTGDERNASEFVAFFEQHLAAEDA